MAVPTHDLGLGLPVFDSGTPLALSPGEYKEAAKSGAESFLRIATIESVSGFTLLQTIERSEAEFKAVKAITNTEIVEHKYGFYPLEAIPKHLSVLVELQQTSNIELIPAGYVLAAEVETIHDIHRLSPLAGRLLDARLRYLYKLPRLFLGKIMIPPIELTHKQFADGFDNNGILRTRLLDIEPRLTE